MSIVPSNSMQNLAQDLEQKIDRYSLATILAILSDICLEKSLHILDNWQDKNLSKHWDKTAAKLIDISNKINI